MRVNRNERNKIIIYFFIIFNVFALATCFITFLIDINNNKGMIPLMFGLLALYSILAFTYFLLYTPVSNNKYEKKNVFKTGYLIFFFINLFLYTLSYIVLWR